MSNTKIIYNEDGSFGVDEDSLNKFDLIFKYNQANNKTVFDNDIHNNEDDQFLNDHIQIINYDH
jgi:hypothetical protein